MAKLAMFMLCDSINNSPNPHGTGAIPSLVSPCVVLRPLFVPGTFSFGITVGVRGVDLENPMELKMQIVSPTGQTVQDFGQAQLPPLGIEDTMPKAYQGFMMNLDIRNMPVPEEGVYHFQIELNGNALETQEIPIYRGIGNASMQ